MNFITNLYQKWHNRIGKAKLYNWRGRNYTMVPGEWTPRFDESGRIFMIISPNNAEKDKGHHG